MVSIAVQVRTNPLPASPLQRTWWAARPDRRMLEMVVQGRFKRSNTSTLFLGTAVGLRMCVCACVRADVFFCVVGSLMLSVLLLLLLLRMLFCLGSCVDS